MFPYQRLRQHEQYGLEDEEEDDDDYYQRLGVIVRPRSWYRLRPLRFKAGHIRKRFRLKVPKLRRLILKKKFRLVSGFRLSCAKVLKRLKESQAHFGDIFAGNYLFLQVNPVSLKSCQANQLKLQGLASRFPPNSKFA